MQRIRNRAQFQAVLAGPPVAKTAHFALHRGALDGEHDGRPLFAVADAWLGVLLPKRWARRAVTRNAIRRQIHAVGESLQPPLAADAHLVRLRAGFARSQFPSASSTALKAAVRAELLLLFASRERR